jgi:hypothetical protein
MAVWARRSSSGIELPAVNGGTASSITYNALLDRAIEVGAKDMVEAPPWQLPQVATAPPAPATAP